MIRPVLTAEALFSSFFTASSTAALELECGFWWVISGVADCVGTQGRRVGTVLDCDGSIIGVGTYLDCVVFSPGERVGTYFDWVGFIIGVVGVGTYLDCVGSMITGGRVGSMTTGMIGVLSPFRSYLTFLAGTSANLVFSLDNQKGHAHRL